MHKKTVASKSKSSSRAINIVQSINPQPFWFRLWIGFMIGANVAFAMMALFVLLNEKLRIMLPMHQGIFFIILGIIDIWFMIRLLRWHKCGLYGTLAVTLISLFLNVYWGAELISSILFAVIPAGITLAFVIPQWSQYK